MAGWLYVVGQVFLWALFGLAMCFSFIIILACGRYKFQPRPKRPKPRCSKPRPPKGRRPEWEALGGTPIVRDGRVVAYEWGPGGIYGTGSPEISYESPDGIGVSIKKLGTTLWLEDA